MKVAKARGKSVADAPAAEAVAGAIVPVTLLVGDDRHTMLEATEALRAALTKQFGEVQTVTFDGAQAVMADVLDELRSMGLMVSTKLVIVESVEALLRSGEEGGEAEATGRPGARRGGGRSARELIESYCQSPEPASFLVLREGAGKFVPGKLPATITACGGVMIRCEVPTPEKAREWLIKRARGGHASAIKPDAAALLVEQVGPERGRLDCELAKLAVAALVAGKESIDAELVAEFSGLTRDDEVWAVQSSVLTPDPAQALARVRELMVVSRHSPASLSWALVDLARKLDGMARGTMARENPFAAAGRLKLWGPGKAMIERLGQRMSVTTSAALLAGAVRCDAMNKSGQGEPAHNVEVLALRFVSAVRQAGG